jgi:hypothetical protein
MALYFASNTNATTPAQQNLSSTAKTMTQITAATATLRRAFIYDFEVGASGAPNSTDCAIVWDLVAQTTLGTGTTGVVTPLDQADAATGSVSTINHTAEPTTTANSQRWTMAMNQRASFRWTIIPGGSGELVVPATNLAGLGIRAKSATYASTCDVGVYFRE